MTRKKGLCLFVCVTAIGAMIDVVSKYLVFSLIPLNTSVPLIPGVVYFTTLKNTGVAFGMFQGGNLVFLVISAIVAVGISVYYYLSRDHSLLTTFGFALILSGTLGNLYDRIFFCAVRDFIDLVFWPVFNIADSLICVGAALLVFSCLKGGTRQKKPA